MIVQVHDFRRIAIRNMALAGVPEKHIMQVTGHKTRYMLDHYNIDREDNASGVYYKTGYNIRQGFSRPIDLDKQSDAEFLAFSKSFAATIGPFQGAKLPVGQVD